MEWFAFPFCWHAGITAYAHASSNDTISRTSYVAYAYRWVESDFACPDLAQVDVIQLAVVVRPPLLQHCRCASL